MSCYLFDFFDRNNKTSGDITADFNTKEDAQSFALQMLCSLAKMPLAPTQRKSFTVRLQGRDEPYYLIATLNLRCLS